MATRSIQDFFDAHDAGYPSLAIFCISAAVLNAHRHQYSPTLGP